MPFQVSSVSASTVATNCFISSLAGGLVSLTVPPPPPAQPTVAAVQDLHRIDAEAPAEEQDDEDDDAGDAAAAGAAADRDADRAAVAAEPAAAAAALAARVLDIVTLTTASPEHCAFLSG